jgi:hypothetical protein
MLQWFFRLIRTGSTPVAVSRPTPQVTVAPEARRTANVSSVVYPPRDPGLPVQEPSTLVSDQSELLDMLRLHAAASPALFQTRFEGPIARVASYINLLPGSSTASFSGAGGLFRAAVETAFSTFRASDGRIFTGSLGVEDRHRLEARWRYVCFVAGLLYPIGGALSSMSVVDANGRKWSTELESLTDFARLNQVTNLFVSWLSEESQLGPSTITGTFALGIVGRENIEWLNEGSPLLVQALVNIVTGSPTSKDLIATALVKDMWLAVNAREMARRHQNYGKLTIGSNISPYLLDAVIGLARTKWVMNKDTMYADAAGLYLEWPAAGQDIIDFCKRKDYPGIPDTDSALLALLTSAKIISSGVDGVAQVPIANADGVVTSAVIVSKPDLLLQSDQTLESVAAGRPVLMEAVRAADPLRETAIQAAPAAAQKPERAKPKRAAPVLPQIDPEQVLLDQEGEGGDGVEATGEVPVTPPDPTPVTKSTPDKPSAAAPVAAEPAPKATPRKPPAPPRAVADLVEGAEVKYSDLLPQDVRTLLPPYHCEILGRLVHMWRSQSAGDMTMRRCEHGAAFELRILSSLSRDPTAFLSKIGELGFLYVNPATAGKMIYPVATAEGAQSTVTCFILAHHTMRRLVL